MEIYIPTLGRYDCLKTINFIPEKYFHKTFLVVIEKEYSKYKKLYKNILVLPKTIKGISPTRQWIMNQSGDKHIAFFDDDLIFQKRKEKNKLTSCKNIGGLLSLWKQWLSEGIALVGVSSRNGNNRIIEEYTENNRVMCGYALNKDIYFKENLNFTDMEVMEDFHLTLSLLKKGYKNRISYLYAHSQPSSNSHGGCSTFRNFELQKQAAYKLSMLHPGLVKIVTKTTKNSWEGMNKKEGLNKNIRVDVIISWKKAYKPKKSNDKKITNISNFFN